MGFDYYILLFKVNLITKLIQSKIQEYEEEIHVIIYFRS